MTLSAHIPNRVILTRLALLAIGFLPLFYFYVWLTICTFLVVLFAGIYLGLWIVLGTLLWWVICITGLAVLLYSSATFTSSRQGLPSWQLAGLIGVPVAAIPLGYLFASKGGWVTCLALFLACCSACYIIISAFRGNRREQYAPSDGDTHPV